MADNDRLLPDRNAPAGPDEPADPIGSWLQSGFAPVIGKAKRTNPVSDIVQGATEHFADPQTALSHPDLEKDVGSKDYAARAGKALRETLDEQAPIEADSDQGRRDRKAKRDELVQQFGKQMGQVADMHKLDQERKNFAGAEETNLAWLHRHATPTLPFLPNKTSTLRANYEEAASRLKDGKATATDYKDIAAYERLQDIDQEGGVWGDIKRGLAGGAKITGEAVIGGKLLGMAGKASGLKFLAPATTESAAAAAVAPQTIRSGLTSLAGGTANLGAQTFMTPTLWQGQAEANAQKNGGSPTDLKNLAPAFALGMTQNAILGQLGSVANGISGAGVGPYLKRVAAKTGTGLIEQQAIDILAGATGLQTGYGVLGDLVRGKGDEALHNLTVQAVTFGAFSAMHGGEHKPVEEVVKALKEAKDRGLSATEAAAEIAPAFKAVTEELQKPSPDPKKAVEALPEASKPLAKTLFDSVPEQAPVDHQAIAARIAKTEGPESAAKYLKAVAGQASEPIAPHVPDATELGKAIDLPHNAGHDVTQQAEATPEYKAAVEAAGKPAPAPETPAAPQTPLAGPGPETANRTAEAVPTQPAKPTEAGSLHNEDHPATKAFLDTFGAGRAEGGIEGSPERVVADLGTGPHALTVELSPGENHGTVRLDYGWADHNRTGKLKGEFTLPLVRKLKELVGRLKEAGQGVEYTAVEGRDDAYRRLLEKGGFEQASGPTGEGNGLRVWKPVAEAKTEPLPAPAEAPVHPLDKIAERVNAGEDVPLAEAFKAAGLTKLEAHVLQERALARSHQDIAADPEAMKRSGKQYTRQAIKQIEQRALAKMGAEQSVDLSVTQTDKVDRALDMIEAGHRVGPGELRDVEQEVRHIARKRYAAADRAAAELDRLTDQYIKEKEDGGNKLPAEREQFYAEQFSRLSEQAQGRPASKEGSPEEVPGRGGNGVEPAPVRRDEQRGPEERPAPVENPATVAGGPAAGETGGPAPQLPGTDAGGEAAQPGGGAAGSDKLKADPATFGLSQEQWDKLSPNERATFGRTKNAFALEEMRLKATGQGTIFHEVMARGGLDPDQAASVLGKEEFEAWRDEAGLPKKLFNKGGVSLEDLATELTRRGIIPEGSKPSEAAMELLAQHHTIDIGAAADAEYKRAEEAHYREMQNEAKSGGDVQETPGGAPEEAGGGEAPAKGPIVPSPEEISAEQQSAIDRFFADESAALRINMDKIKAAYGFVKGKVNEFTDSIKTFLAPAGRSAESRETAGSVRENNAILARKTEIAHEVLKAGKAFFDAVPEALKKPTLLQFTDAIEGGTIHTLPAEMRPIAEAVRELIDLRTEQLRARGLLKTFVQDYLGHIWKKAGATGTPDEQASEIGRMFAARRPLAGSESFRKQRSIPTYRDGIEAGLEPASWNPIDLVLMNLRQMDKSIMGRDTFNELKENGLVKFFRLGERAPEGWIPFNDRLSKVFAPAEITHEGETIKLAGPQLVGNYYAPEPVSTLLNNHLSPGLTGNAAFDAFRGLGNTLNQFQLGFSFFHLGFVTMDTQVSAASLAAQHLSRGEFKEAGKQLLGAAIPLVAPIRQFVQGSKMLKEYYAPGSQGAEMGAIMNKFMEGGGRAKMDQWYGGTHLGDFVQAVRRIKAGDTKAFGSALWHAVPALAEAVSYPVMNYIVPRMKMGVFADMARAEMAREGIDMTSAKARDVMGKAWDSVENRLGQLTYDNVFWNRTFKDALMAGVRSVGWNLGTVRELGGGVKDLAKLRRGELTARAAYVLGLPMVTALYGALYQHVATGQGPDEMKDYFFPKNGRMRDPGVPDRVSLPSYMRDVGAFTNRADEGPWRLAQNAAGMATGKLNPGLTTVWEMLHNEDFYGKAIRNGDDPVVKQSMDSVQHLLSSFTPFGVTQFEKQQKEGADFGQSAQSFFGVTPAPAYIAKTNEQLRAEENKRKVTMTPLGKKQREDEETFGFKRPKAKIK